MRYWSPIEQSPLLEQMQSMSIEIYHLIYLGDERSAQPSNSKHCVILYGEFITYQAPTTKMNKSFVAKLNTGFGDPSSVLTENRVQQTNLYGSDRLLPGESLVHLSPTPQKRDYIFLNRYFIRLVAALADISLLGSDRYRDSLFYIKNTYFSRQEQPQPIGLGEILHGVRFAGVERHDVSEVRGDHAFKLQSGYLRHKTDISPFFR